VSAAPVRWAQGCEECEKGHAALLLRLEYPPRLAGPGRPDQGALSAFERLTAHLARQHADLLEFWVPAGARFGCTGCTHPDGPPSEHKDQLRHHLALLHRAGHLVVQSL